jgi:hypothetical protein
MNQPDPIDQPQLAPDEQADEQPARIDAPTPAPRFFGFSDDPEALGWNEGSWGERPKVEPS